jgi:hypothetical protein
MSKSAIRRTLTNPAVQAVVFTILLLVLIYTSSYIDGVRGGYSSLFYVLMIIPFYLILMLLPFVRAIIGVCTSCWHIRTVPRESIMSVVVLVIVVAAPLAPFFVSLPGADPFLKGYKLWAQKHVDIDAIQDWIAKAPDCYWNEPETYNSREGKPDGFPQCLKDCKFQYVFFEQSDLDNSKVVRLEWGGGMSHWGVVIGLPQMKMPDKRKCEISESHEVESRNTVKPGAYVYERG